jgi:chemotaxis protein CheD
MGELAVSADADEELVAIGLGSCIGLAIVDRYAGVCGLAHVVLPQSPGGGAQPGKFADLAVPELIEQLLAAGARRARLEVAIAGGARMFALGGSLDVGARNDAAVRTALIAAGLNLRALDTGGSRGRTVRIDVGTCTVTAQVAGGDLVALLASARPATRPAVAAAGGLR